MKYEKTQKVMTWNNLQNMMKHFQFQVMSYEEAE